MMVFGGTQMDNNMKVLFISAAPVLYGAEKVLLNMASSFGKAGFEVHVFVPGRGRLWEELQKTKGVRVHAVFIPRLTKKPAGMLKFLFGWLPAVVNLVWQIKKIRPRVVYVNALANIVSGVAGFLAGRPVVWHLHERNQEGLPGKLLAGLITALADRVIFISRFVQDTYAQLWSPIREKGTVVYNGVELDEKLLAKPLPEPVSEIVNCHPGYAIVGTIAHLYPHKRIDDFILAAEKTLVVHPGTIFLILGDGPLMSRLDGLIRARGLEANIFLLGYQANVFPVLKIMDVVVFPFQDEGFGLVAVEAMLAGKPVVAAKHGGLPEVVTDGLDGFLCPLGDTDGLAEKTCALLSSAELRKRMGEHGYRKCREQFALDRQFGQIRSIIDDLGKG